MQAMRREMYWGSHFSSALVSMVLVCTSLLVPSAQPRADFHEKMTWTEADDSDSDRTRYTLEYWVRNRTTKYHLRTKVILQSPVLGTETGDLTSTYDNASYAKVSFACAVRVQGLASPQLLIQRHRPNWMDYVLYDVGSEGISEAFSFSCRDEQTVKWIHKNRALTAIVVYDRFGVPSDLLAKERPGW